MRRKGHIYDVHFAVLSFQFGTSVGRAHRKPRFSADCWECWERFDLVFRQRDYFRHGPQALLKFMHSPTFRVRAKEFGGYDVEFAGEVRGVQ